MGKLSGIAISTLVGLCLAISASAAVDTETKKDTKVVTTVKEKESPVVHKVVKVKHKPAVRHHKVIIKVGHQPYWRHHWHHRHHYRPYDPYFDRDFHRHHRHWRHW